MFEFAWKVFKLTGNVDAYLLFKELDFTGSAGRFSWRRVSGRS